MIKRFMIVNISILRSATCIRKPVKDVDTVFGGVCSNGYSAPPKTALCLWHWGWDLPSGDVAISWTSARRFAASSGSVSAATDVRARSWCRGEGLEVKF